MLDGVYGNYLKMIALKELTKSADIPNVELCIGDAEQLQSIPVLIFKNVTPHEKEAIREHYTEVPYEKVGLHFELDPLTMEDFDHGVFYGEALERW